jgi:hypothetical protein
MPRRAAGVFWVGRDRGQGLGRGLEQQVVDNGLVLVGDVGIAAGSVNTTWKYGTGSRSALRAASQSFARPLALRTLPVAAGVVRDLAMRAFLTACDMPAEGRGAAVLDRRHHLELAEADMAGIGPAPRPWPRNMSATSSDGRDTRRASGGWFGAVLELARDAIERAHDLPDGLGGDTRTVVSSLACPNKTWITLISVFCSRRCVAKL